MAVDPQKYSIYSQRSADKQYVNWGKVATDVSTGLQLIASERQAKRDALDKLTTEAINNLSQVPDVNSAPAGSLIIGASDMSKKNLMIQSDLLKRGLITEKDYQLFLNQQKTGYTNLSTAVKRWDEWYQKSLENIEKDTASALEIYGNTTLQAFGNLNNKTLWTNPTNGQMQLVEMGKDEDGNYTIMPNASDNPEKFLNPNSINVRMNMRDEKKVLNDEVKKLVDPLGRVMKQYTDATGEKWSKEGFRFKGDKGDRISYEEWLDAQVGTLTATENDMMQILMEESGYGIAQTQEEFEEKYCNKKRHNADVDSLDKGETINQKDEDYFPCDHSKWIQVSYEDGVAKLDLSKEQIEEAKDIARYTVDSQIDDMTTVDREPSPSGKGDIAKLKLGEDRIKTIGEVYSSKDPEVVERAIKTLLTTSDDRFAEFDQVTVGEGDNAIVTEIIVPYIDSTTGDKVSKPIKLHELKEGATEGSTDPKDYVAVSPGEFTQGMYEIISMGDTKYVPYSEVSKYVNNELVINPTGKKSYKPKRDVYVDPREGITIESPIGSGKTLTNVKEIYTPTITTILGKSVNVSAENVAELANKMNEAIRQAAVQQKDDEAANRVKITNISDKSIEIQIEGEETKTTIKIPGAFEYDSSNLESQIDNVMNEVLKKILPAIEGGYGDTNTDPLKIN